MSSAQTDTDQTLWNTDTGSIQKYWLEYESMRPAYGGSGFLDLIYEYHASKAVTERPSSFSTAHDVACGAGKAGLEVARRFQTLVASDSNDSSLKAMELCRPSDLNNIQYVTCAAEDISEYTAPASVDLITAAECVPILDVPRALNSFSKVLNPNGTLALWFYGRLHFSEPTFKATCQPLFDRILEDTFHMVIHARPPESQATWARAAETMESWLDNVSLPHDQWRMLQRHKWNSQSMQMGMGSAANGLGVVRRSAVKEGELVSEREDPSFWERQFDIDDVKAYVYSSFPGIEPSVRGHTAITRLFDELGESMGGRGTKRRITWPVSLILATPAVRGSE